MLLRIAIVFAIVLLVPMVCHKVRIPSIVGFILFGMLIGPYGTDLMSGNATISILGKIGILYIMFQSGCEIDLNEMKDHRWKALLFGFYSFAFPLIIGFATSFFLFDFGLLTSILLGAMYGSHTLMSYPIVSRYGVQKSRAVNIVVGGTMLAVSLSLLVLAMVKNHQTGSESWQAFIFIPLSVVAIMWLFPLVAQWFFKRNHELIANFMLVMFMLVLAALLMEWAGMDGILGAFLCGIALNRLLPGRSQLTQRVIFVGNSLFVPLFLLSVGMLIDIHAFFAGWQTLLIALVMVASKLSGKWLSAWLAQWQWHFSKEERQLLFGLTQAASAGTLAIVTIGYQIGLFPQEVLNASVLMILILCTLSSFETEHAAKTMALQAETQLDDVRKEEHWQLASLENDSLALKQLANLSQLSEPVLAPHSSWENIAQIIEQDSASLAVYQEQQPLNTISRLVVAIPRYAEKESDFISCFEFIRRLAIEIGADVVFFAHSETEVILHRLCKRQGQTLHAHFRELDAWEDVLLITKDLQENDLVVFLSSRPSTASYNPLFRELPNMLTRFFNRYSYLLIYPNQQTAGVDVDSLLMETPQTSSWHLFAVLKAWLQRKIREWQMTPRA